NLALVAWEMRYLGLDSHVIFEEPKMTAPTRLGLLPVEVRLSTAVAAWLVDRHADRKEDWLDIADRWADALVISNEERSALLRCLEIYRTLETTWDRLGVAKQKRLAARPEFDQSLLLMQATDRQRFVDVRRRVLELAKT